MSDLRLVAAACLAVFLTGSQGMAQGLAGPVNLPPSSFDGQQFNDNNGCAYMRAGLSGSTVWVPRVSQDREPICGLAPTFGVAAPVAAVAPAVEAPAPQVAAPAETAGAPIATVASVTTAPRVSQPAPVAAVEPAPRRMTVAQICAETAATGQVFTDSATGEPVVCPTAAPVVLAAAVAQPVAAAEPLRMTRADACQLGAQTGVRYVDAATGLPIVCDSVATAAAPNVQPGLTVGGVEVIAPQVPASNPTGLVAAYAGPPPGYEPVWTDGRLNRNRGFIPIATSQYQVPLTYDRVSTSGGFMPIALSDMQARLAAEHVGAGDRVSSQNVP